MSIWEVDAMADEHYDAIVIGTSQGGRFLPIELAKAGQKVYVDRTGNGESCCGAGDPECRGSRLVTVGAREQRAHSLRPDVVHSVRPASPNLVRLHCR
jgi:choline dehydrogenase-like flavoprotein